MPRPSQEPTPIPADMKICKRGHPQTPDNRTTQRWCKECKRQRSRAQYGNLTGMQYNRILLRHRRSKALGRMARRKEEK